MKTKTIQLYEYAELSPEAKEKALSTWRNEDFDSYGLQVHLDEAISVLLERHGIVPVATADGRYQSQYARVYFSLSHSQGDGVMFEGTFHWKKWHVVIKHSGRYYHSNSKEIDITTNDQFFDEADEATCDRFEAIYQSICKELEREGYAYIDEAESEDAFIEACNANEWTFREDGTLENI